tara:strand:- start:210 stop:800 length:591 start_codon:yes stop_codon:yes gene_type:complete
MAIQVEYKTTAELIPYVNNSRTHSEEQIQQVAASIKEFGFTNPILIDEQGGIIAGHGRLSAAQLLKLTEIPTITLYGLTETQKKAYVIADNQLALNSGWDLDKLKLEIEGLDFDLDLLGFGELELESLVGLELDMSMLDDDDVNSDVSAMSEGVRKAIQVEFESHDYDEAQELVKKYRAEGAYIGAILIEALRGRK